MSKYRPDYHSAVVNNLRRGYLERFSEALTLTDEEIWSIFEEWHGVVDEDHPEDKEICMMNHLRNVQQRRDAMVIGFTGTQAGMTDAQKKAIVNFLPWRLSFKPNTLHHGDCIGADAEMHELFCRHLNPTAAMVVIHPPNIKSKRAFCGTVNRITPLILETKPYLVRNRDIVDATEFLVATPKEMEDVIRSGTWYTIRYARSRKKPILIIYPTGEERRERWNQLR